MQVVDLATGYQAARFLRSMSAEHAWEAIRACWIDVYLRPPQFLVHDPGTNFNSDEFRGNAHSMGIEVKQMPVEAHHSIGKVERYHIPLRRAYDILSIEAPQIGREERLQSAVKAVNDTAGPDGLIPTLLVYGAYPRLSKEDKPTPSNTARARAIERAMDDVRRSNAKIAITEAIRTTRGPDVAAVLGLPLNAKVLVWREKPKSWTGPWRIVAREGYICKIDFDGRIIDMRITSVKPYKEIDEKKELPEDTPSNGNSSIRPT